MARQQEQDTPQENAPEKKSTVAELAKKHGQILPELKGELVFSPEHASAAILNAWTFRKHFHGEDVQLTDAQYLGALEAAKEGKPFESANFTPKKAK